MHLGADIAQECHPSVMAKTNVSLGFFLLFHAPKPCFLVFGVHKGEEVKSFW